MRRRDGVRWGGGDILIGCLFSCNCRSQSFQGVVLILAQGRHVGCWSLSLACMFFFFSHFEMPPFPPRGRIHGSLPRSCPLPACLSPLCLFFFWGGGPTQRKTALWLRAFLLLAVVFPPTQSQAGCLPNASRENLGGAGRSPCGYLLLSCYLCKRMFNPSCH